MTNSDWIRSNIEKELGSLSLPVLDKVWSLLLEAKKLDIGHVDCTWERAKKVMQQGWEAWSSDPDYPNADYVRCQIDKDGNLYLFDGYVRNWVIYASDPTKQLWRVFDHVYTNSERLDTGGTP